MNGFDSLPAASQGGQLGWACQTYSWQMTEGPARAPFAEIAAAVARAGFPAIEPEVIMLGQGLGRIDSHRVRDELAAAGIQLAVLCLALEWRGSTETELERITADATITTVIECGATMINLVQLPYPDRSDLEQRQAALAAHINAVSARARAAGVSTTFHPNSPAGSVCRTEQDYNRMFELLDPEIGFCPDLGHLVRGGMDPLELISTYRERVNHVHVKDVSADGTWMTTGEGVVDIAGVIDYLAAKGYRGWIAMEDECAQAERDPAGAAARNAHYVREQLQPLVAGAGRLG